VNANQATVGVLLMSYGTPATAADVEAYYTHIRRGNEPTPQQLADLHRRYDAIGGTSPLAARTRAQAECVQAALDASYPGRYRVFLGAKHAPPFIEEAVATIAEAGITRAVALVLAPHYSTLSVGEYLERAEAAGQEAGVKIAGVRSWHLEPVLIDLLAGRLRQALDRLSTPPSDTVVLVTAHSLPRRIVATGDPYPAQLEETARAVAEAAGVGRWRTGWQSAGRTPEEWLGPDVTVAIEEAATEGARGVVVCPAGFTSDHLEILYDLDIEARAVAEAKGLAYGRTDSLNDDPAFCAMLAEVVVRATP
jgi:ferrochelatase